MKKVIAFLWAGVLALGLLTTGCAGEKEEKETGAEASQREELQKVTLNEVAHSIFYAPQYVAIEEGYFVEEGIKLEVVTGFGADKVMASVLSGESDIGFMGSESSIYAYQQGANDPVINFAQLTQRAGNFIVAREEMPDFQWTDLVGKDVLGGRKSGMPEMVFEYILKQKGIDPDQDLNIDRSIDFGSTAAAFAGGQVVASCGVESGYVPYTAYSAKESYIEENPEIIQGFVNALQKGMDYVNSHTPEEIAGIIQPQFKENDLETITTIVKRYQEQDTWKENLVFEKESFELLQDILDSAGELEERVPYEKLVDTAYAKKALEN